MAAAAQRTKPELWEEVKAEITASDKGGYAGQWSARKAQMAVQEYKRRGGGYVGAKRADNHLAQWTREDWGTRSGEDSLATGERYLPKAARDALTDEEYRRTTQKKRVDLREGRQFSRQPADIARKTAPFRNKGKSAMSQKNDDDDIRGAFEGAVDMSASELERWPATKESQSVGWTYEGERESVGHQSGRRILEIKSKCAGELRDEDYAHMRKVTGYVHRHLAQGPQHDAENSRWRYSLMNWGHDPMKERRGN